MTTYVVFRKDTGEEVMRYTAPAPVEWAGCGFDTTDHVAQPDSLPVEQEIPPEETWERTVFLRRFTPAERILARNLRKTDPILNDFWDLLESAPEVHSHDPDLRRGILYLVALGALTQARASEILGMPL